MSRHSWFRSIRSPSVLLLALIVLLGVGGFVFTSTTIRRDRDAAAQRRARVEAVHAQEVLGRARAYVAGLADVLVREREPGQARFARWADATSASVGLNDVLWVERVRSTERRRYERLRGVPITRLTPSGRLARAPAARSYLPATFTSQTRPELRPGVDVTGFGALEQALRDRARIFAVGASRPGTLGPESGFYLLQAASFARGPDSPGYLVAFVPRGWFATALGGDPRLVAISEDGRRIEGQLDAVHASAGFEMLGRRWRIDVDREPPSGLQSTLPWLALAWPFAIAGIALLIGRATTLRRRAQREVDRIFELSLDLISVVGFDGRFNALNPAFERTLGYARRDMVGRPFWDFVHPDDRDASREFFTAVLSGDHATQFENRYVCADGSERWLQWSPRAVAEQGVVYSIARDVTERRRIEAELREAQRTAEAQGAELQVRAGEQAALRRLATLVAKEAPPAAVLAKVAEELGGVLGNADTALFRAEGDGTATAVAVWGPRASVRLALGTGRPVDGCDVVARALREGRPCRVDDLSATTGALSERADGLGLEFTVGCPIVVRGGTWGAIAVGPHAPEPLAAETETQIARFAELAATAIANADARAEVERLAEEQAGLRRVATLVAHGATPSAVFDAVAAEMERMLGADVVTLGRYEPNDEIIVLAYRGAHQGRLAPGTRVSHLGHNVTTMVRRAARSAQIDHHDTTHGALAGLDRSIGGRASVGAPIVVDRRLWGVATATWRGEQSPPADAEQRMVQFTELLDTAIANADSRAQLNASRTRLVTEADEARRRVVRDLHDGAQQRLVHTIVTLKLAQRALADADGEVASLVGEALEQAERGNAELRELAHGILPAALTHGGLGAGVDAVADRLDLPVEVDVPAQRFPAEIERSAYFIVAEALTNIVKHAAARQAVVRAAVDDAVLQIEVRDDGIGGADPDGHGLVGLRDRATALGGRLDVDSPPGGGTVVNATLPLRS